MKLAINKTVKTMRRLLPAVAMFSLFSVCAMAQFGTGNVGTITSGASTAVQIIRAVGGIVFVGLLVFSAFSFAKSIAMGLSAIAGAIIAIIVAGNAQGIVNMFYSVTG